MRLSFGSSGIPFGIAQDASDAVVLEAQVPVQPRRVVLLDDEPGQASPSLGDAALAPHRRACRQARASLFRRLAR